MLTSIFGIGQIHSQKSFGSGIGKGTEPICLEQPQRLSIQCQKKMVYEMYKQLQGKSGERQVKDPKLGLTHNMGGMPTMALINMAIVGREKG